MEPEDTPSTGSFLLARGSEPLPGYRLVERLGSGGFGEVWRAEAQGGFQVALKFVRLDKTGAVELRSLEILKAIRHPNLLITFGAWQVAGFLILAMELADRTLLDRLQEAQTAGLAGIPRDELIEYFREAAKGIDHLNEHKHTLEGKEGVGVQHRDIKPQNIFMVGSGVKVADFGLARFLEHTATSHTGSLTMAYAAPEFFQGRTASQSDQYSFGVTYCHLRGGRVPFDGKPAEIMAGHLFNAPDLTMLPVEERPLVGKALAKEPSQRWPNCRAFVEALSASQPTKPPARAEDAVATFQSPEIVSALSLETPNAAAGTFQKASATAPSSFSTLPAAMTAAPQASAVPPISPAPSKADTAPAGGLAKDTIPAGHGAPTNKAESAPASRKAAVWFTAAVLAAVGSALWAAGLFSPWKPLTAAGSPSFTLDVPQTLDVKAGSKEQFTVRVNRKGLTTPVEIAFVELPDKVTIAPALIPGDRDSVRLEVAAARGARPGAANIKIVGTAEGKQQAVNLSLRVNKPDGFLKLLPITPVSVRAGQKANFDIRVERTDLDDPIEVRAPEMPDKIILDSLTILAGANTARATVAAARDVALAEREIKLVATSGKVRTEGSFTLRLDKAPSLSVEVPERLELRAGKKRSVTVRVARDGVEGPVSIRFEGLPVGVTAKDAMIAEDANTTEIEFAAADDVARAEQRIKLLASAGSVGTEAGLALAVEKAARLRMELVPTTVLVRAGKKQKAAIAITRESFVGPVTIRFRDLPSGVTIADLIIPPNTDQATATIAARENIEEGEREIRVAGSSGPVAAEAEVAATLKLVSAPLHRRRGDSALNNAHFDGAIDEYTKAIRIEPDDKLSYRERGRAYWKKGQHDKAISDCTEAIRLDPKFDLAFNERGNAYEARKEYDTAIADYDEAIRLNPRHFVFYSNRASAYLNKGEYDKCIADCTESIRLSSSFADAFNYRGEAYGRKKEYDKAIADYTEAIRLKPQNAAYRGNRGSTYCNKREYDKAIADCTEAIRLDPNYALAYQRRGVAHEGKKEYDKAIADYGQAIRLSPQSAASHASRGGAYVRKNEYDKAIADCTEAIRLDPNYAHAYNHRGNAYFLKKDYDRAIAEYDRAIRLLPRDAALRANRGQAYLQKGDNDRAVADCTEAIRLDPKNARAYRFRALAHEKQGNSAAAQADREKAERIEGKKYEVLPLESDQLRSHDRSKS